MPRIIAALLILVSSLSLAAASDSSFKPASPQLNELIGRTTPEQSEELLRSIGLLKGAAPLHALACCKVCRKGKACGDTCISRNDECHVSPGCACDG
jgi:hypothetical protein